MRYEPTRHMNARFLATGLFAGLMAVSVNAAGQRASTGDLTIEACPAGKAGNQSVRCGDSRNTAVAVCRQRCCDLDALRARARQRCRSGTAGGKRSSDYNSSISNPGTVTDSDSDGDGIADHEYGEANEAEFSDTKSGDVQAGEAKNFNSSRSNRGSVVNPDKSDPTGISVRELELRAGPQDSKKECEKAGGAWVCDMGPGCFCFRELEPDVVDASNTTP